MRQPVYYRIIIGRQIVQRRGGGILGPIFVKSHFFSDRTPCQTVMRNKFTQSKPGYSANKILRKFVT